MGDAESGPVQLSFNPQLRVEFQGATVTSADAAVVPAAPDEAHGRAGRRLRQAVDSRSMRRTWIGLGTAVAVVFFSAVILAVAQPAARVARIGYLTAAGGGAIRSLEALRLGLRDLGYVEGQHYVIEARAAQGQLDRVPGLAAELVRLKVDVIVAGGPQAAIPARAATPTIPIVLAFSEDPVAIGLVQSLSRPGGNVTGLSHMSVELASKRLELLKEAVPRVSRVAVFWDSTIPEKVLEFRHTERAAQLLRIQLQSAEVRRPADLERVFAEIVRERADAFVALNYPQLDPTGKRLPALAVKSRLPGLCPDATWVENGCLMAYAPNRLESIRRQVAVYVDKLLKGASAAELPVEQAASFDLSINGRTAEALGLPIPPALLYRAHRVIQ